MIAGIGLIGTVTWLCEPQITGKINHEAAGAFAVALVVWIFSCLPDGSLASARWTPQITAEGDAAGIAKLKNMLIKIEEILKLLG